MNMKERTIDFDELMGKVQYHRHASPEYGQYVMEFDGCKYRFKGTEEVVPTISREGWIVTHNGLPMTGHEFIAYSHEGINVGDWVTVLEEIPTYVEDGKCTCKPGERFRVKSIRLVGEEYMLYLSTGNFFTMPFRARVDQVEKFDMDKSSKVVLMNNMLSMLSIRAMHGKDGHEPCSVCHRELVPKRMEGDPLQTVNINGETVSLPENRNLCEACLDNLANAIDDQIGKIAIETREVQS